MSSTAWAPRVRTCVTDWIRRKVAWLSYWHLGQRRTSQGMVIAHCGSTFTGDDDVQVRPFDDPPPSAERCPVCQAAYWSRVIET